MQIEYKSFDSTRYFGVEMETTEKVPRDVMGAIIRKVDPSRETIVSGWTLTGAGGGVPETCWSVKTDSTCASFPGNHGHEIASFKASGSSDLQLIGDVAEAVQKSGVKVNMKCGVHVHADIGDWSRSQVGVMLANWCKAEEVISHILPPHRRNNPYAKLLCQKHRLICDVPWKAESLYAKIAPANLEVHNNRDKRVAINLLGYATGLVAHSYSRKTAELRLPEGTLDRYDIENWARFYVHFIDQCLNRSMPPDIRPVGLDDALVILGLQGTDQYYLLSSALYQTKRWFLERLIKFSTSATLFREAVAKINNMVEPNEKYIEIIDKAA